MISVTILTKNSAKHLKQVLEALGSFDEVLVYDTGSVDETLDIAKNYANVTILQAPFEGFGPTHNKASQAAKYDWILSIDSDEIATSELVEEIHALSLDCRHVYSFPRKNYYRGKWIRGCGWHPDRQMRLYHRKQTQFTEAQVHEAVIVDHLLHVPLKAAIVHYPYETTADFLNKMQTYSQLFAEQYQGRRASSTFKAIGHGVFAFLKSYFLKKGFLGASEGFIISVYNANTAFYKYLKLAEKNRQISHQR